MRTGVLFLYWGRRGAMVRFSIDLARAARDLPDAPIAFSLSRQGEALAPVSGLGLPLLPVDTFSTGPGMALSAWRIPRLRRELAAFVRAHRIGLVVNLMPHVWTPFASGGLRGAGARYAVVVHDADAHPGDRTALAKPILDLDLKRADRILTLSDAVTRRLVGSGRVEVGRIRTLFHPDFAHGTPASPRERRPGDTLRLLFLGRILPYKGLPLLAEAFRLLRAEGMPVDLTVMGEGETGAAGEMLTRLGARIENRWLSEPEIAEALGAHDALVLSHVEASQSGVVASAFGAGLPVIATPVGGLTGQIADGRTGLLASAVTAPALAAAIARLAADPALEARLRIGVLDGRNERSIARFLNAAIDAAKD